MIGGRLNRRIVIQRKTETLDSFGQPIETWTTLHTLWADPRPVTGSERFTAQQVAGNAVMTFAIGWISDIHVEDRISYDGKLWDIHDIREIGRREGLEIDCTARSEE